MQRVDEEVFAVSNWLQEFVLDFQVDCCIATPERGYPTSEAAYGSVEEWEAATGKDFYATMAAAA